MSVPTSRLRAQQYQANYSEPLEPIERGKEWRTRIPCSNGSTISFLFTGNGINVDIYDKSGKVVNRSTQTSKLWDVSNTGKSGFVSRHEWAGNIVLFVSQPGEPDKQLFRLVFSIENGQLIREDGIAQLPGGEHNKFPIDWNFFRVAADPLSGAYAVCIFDGSNKNYPKRIEVVHFDSDHKEIQRYNYNSAENQFPVIQFLGMAVNGIESIVLFTYGIHHYHAHDPGTRIIVSNFYNGKTSHTALPNHGNKNLWDSKWDFAYNTRSKHAYLLSSYVANSETSSPFMKSKIERTNFYRSTLVAASAKNNSLVYTQNLNLSPILTSYRNHHFKNGPAFQGIPQELIVNSDTTIGVVVEEINEVIENSRGRRTRGDLGIVKFGPSGVPGDPLVIRKSQVWYQPSYNIVTNSGGQFIVLYRTQELQLPGDKGSIALSDKEKEVMVCQLTSSGVKPVTLTGLPSHEVLTREYEHFYADYCEPSGDLVMIVTENLSRKKTENRVVWMHLK